MKKLLACALILVLIASYLLIVTNFANGESTYKVSGYILDGNGEGIAGALFTMYPAGQVKTDNSGYYEIFGASQFYDIFVWPPFDSNYLAHIEKGFFVGATDTTKNITLNVGIKLSGYIKDISGAPIKGALGFLDQHYTGWYSNSSGFYFITAPSGTYTLTFEPRTGPMFETFTEFNVALTQDTVKNITIGDPANLPRYDISGYILDSKGQGIAGAEIIFGVTYVTSVISDSTGYYSTTAPSGTYHINVWPPFDSNYLSYDHPVLIIGNVDVTQNYTLNVGCKVSGYLTDSEGNPIRGAITSLSKYVSGWYSNDSGYYFTTAPSGIYTLKIQPRTGPDFPIYTEANFNLTSDISRNFILLASQSTSTPANDQKIFEVQSNSTVSELVFNSNDNSLSFKVSGPSGTSGYTKAVISKSIMPNFTGTTLSIDGKNLTFTVTSTNDYWIMEFTYSHSSHQVVIDLVSVSTTPVPSQSPTALSTIPEFTPCMFVMVLVFTIVAVVLARKKFIMPHHMAK